MATLCATVQHNCNISDARYARDYSMCVYLLRMQEHYRWKQSIPFTDTIDKKALGNWVRETEDYWDTIEEENFLPLPINGESFEPFDEKNINRALTDANLGYTAGIGRLGQPHFVLAERRAQRDTPYPQLELGREWARDTITLPAMTRNGAIVIRHAAIKQMLWQMIAEWRLHRNPGPMARVVAHYDINADSPHDAQITAAAQDLSVSIVYHERGEIITSKLLGPRYKEMISSLQGRPGEGYVRAVGDLLADAHSTWPFIVEQQNSNYLDFWLAGLHGIRQSLLQPTTFYRKITQTDHPLSMLNSQIKHEQQRWSAVAEVLLETFAKRGIKANFKSAAESALHTSEQHS